MRTSGRIAPRGPLVLVALLSLVACPWARQDAPPWRPHAEVGSLPDNVREEIRAAEARAAETPNDADVVGELGSVYFSYKFNVLAAECFERSARLDPASFQWVYFAGTSRARANDLARAVALFERALALDGEYAPLLESLAELVFEADVERASALYARAVELEPDRAQAHLGLARCAARKDDVEAAIAHLRRALELRPQFGTAHYELALLLHRSGETEAAAEHMRLYQEHGVTTFGGDPIKRVLRRNLNEPKAIQRRANALWQDGRNAEATRYLEEQVETNPEQEATRDLLGHAYLREGRLGDAERTFRALLADNPGYLEPRTSLAVVLDRLGRRDEAEQLLREGLEHAPGSALVLHQLALFRASGGHVGEGIELMRRAVAAQPASAPYRVDLGRMLHDDGREEAALVEFRAATEVEPAYADGWDRYTSTALATGRDVEAVAALDRAIVALPKERALQARLAWVLATTSKAEVHDPLRAVRVAEEVCAATKQRVHAYLDVLAAAYGAAQRVDDAIRTATRAIELATAANAPRATLRAYGKRLEYYENMK